MFGRRRWLAPASMGFRILVWTVIWSCTFEMHKVADKMDEEEEV
jgi:hypothetical protein